MATAAALPVRGSSASTLTDCFEWDPQAAANGSSATISTSLPARERGEPFRALRDRPGDRVDHRARIVSHPHCGGSVFVTRGGPAGPRSMVEVSLIRLEPEGQQ